MTHLNDSVFIHGLAGEHILTYTGSVIGALSISRIEPNQLSEHDRISINELIRNVIQRLPTPITFTQYYIHQDNT